MGGDDLNDRGGGGGGGGRLANFRSEDELEGRKCRPLRRASESASVFDRALWRDRGVASTS